jgi:hypothetical protein
MLKFSRMFLPTFAKPVLVAVYFSRINFKTNDNNKRIKNISRL